MSGMFKEELFSLSVPERLQLLEDLWESLCNEPGAVPLSEEQKLELDRRLANYHSDPAGGASWEIVRQRILNRK